ncbi:glycosyltransferase [Candidatus Gottesmanbacteria bacterium]|nr:glycosyltransferase [Candidatus Gottesmanbacteria bacterium]
MKQYGKFRKIAIVHDAVLCLGGAERVLYQLLRLFPDADMYIPILQRAYRWDIRKRTNGDVRTTILSSFPRLSTYASFLKPILFWYWEHLDLSGYDLVISSSHSFSSKSIRVSSRTLHVSYIHTPPRYLYNEYNEMRWMKHPFIQFALSPLFGWLKKKDFEGAQRPDILIANSKTVQKRIWNYYKRKSIVIYPSVHIPSIKVLNKPRSLYFLCVSRLVKQKGIDLAIRACNDLKLPLYVVGTGPEERRLRSIAGPTVHFCGFVPDNRMADMYAGAKALLSCAIDEDFGMAPVEAMAQGVPVIAYASGGIRETVVFEKTGILFYDYTVGSLKKAFRDFELISFDAKICRKQADTFSEKRFIRRFEQIIKKYEKENTLS